MYLGSGEARGRRRSTVKAKGSRMVAAAGPKVAAIFSLIFRVSGELRPEIGVAPVKLGREEARGGSVLSGEEAGVVFGHGEVLLL